MGSDDRMRVARRSAWAEFGSRHWRWFVFGPFIAKALGWLCCTLAVVAAGFYAIDHRGPVIVWVAERVFGILGVSALLSVFAIGAFLVWRFHGWRLEIEGVSRKSYTTSCVVIVLVSAFLIGVWS